MSATLSDNKSTLPLKVSATFVVLLSDGEGSFY